MFEIFTTGVLLVFIFVASAALLAWPITIVFLPDVYKWAKEKIVKTPAFLKTAPYVPFVVVVLAGLCIGLNVFYAVGLYLGLYTLGFAGALFAGAVKNSQGPAAILVSGAMLSLVAFGIGYILVAGT